MIRFENVSFRYASSNAPALSGIDLQIGRGECVVVAGASGCGKTSLLRCINGLIPHVERGERTGQVLLDGREVARLETPDIAGLVGSVFQDPRSQFFTTNTLDELVFGCENLGMPPERMRQRLEAAMAVLEIAGLIDRSVFKLSSGERQKIAIASAYAMDPAVLVLDEPSSNLDPGSILRLREVFRQLGAQGKTLVVAEHRLYYLADLADRLVCMEGGRIAAVYDRRQIASMSASDAERLELRALDLPRLPLAGPITGVSGSSTPPAVELRGVTFGYGRRARPVLQDLGARFRPGEIVALAGANGAGKTTLIKLLSGLLRQSSGEIRFDGVRTGAGRRIAGTHLVMQDVDYQLFAESVEGELMLGFRADAGHRRKAEAMLQSLGLDQERRRHPASLSGGQKQRLAVAVSLLREARVMIFDEPTSGMDRRNLFNLSGMLRNLALGGCLIIVVTHDFEFITAACQRLLWLERGTIREDTAVGRLPEELAGFFGLDGGGGEDPGTDRTGWHQDTGYNDGAVSGYRI